MFSNSGVAINRLLDRNAELSNIKKLEKFFGLSEEKIRNYFYNVKSVPTLLGDKEIVRKVINSIERISSLYCDQLKSIWKHVIPNPLRLNNSRGSPIYHFVMASNNKNAVKIASQIIEKG